MSAASHNEHDHAHEHGYAHVSTYLETLRANRLGLWLFCISEVFLFAALLTVRFALWGDTRPELDQALGLISTVVLLVSSYFMVRAEIAIANNERGKFLNSLLITFVLGLGFLIAVVGFEWGAFGIVFGDHELLKPTDGAYGAVFYGLTGIHAFHVFTGLILILLVYINGMRGGYSAEKHWGVEACAIYWHFVDVVWVFFYPALYLVGTVAAH